MEKRTQKDAVKGTGNSTASRPSGRLNPGGPTCDLLGDTQKWGLTQVAGENQKKQLKEQTKNGPKGFVNYDVESGFLPGGPPSLFEKTINIEHKNDISGDSTSSGSNSYDEKNRLDTKERKLNSTAKERDQIANPGGHPGHDRGDIPGGIPGAVGPDNRGHGHSIESLVQGFHTRRTGPYDRAHPCSVLSLTPEVSA